MLRKLAPPERIDGLAVVPHGHDVFMGEGEQTHQFGLEVVGVLVLVHHDVAVAGGEARAHVLMVGQEAAAFQEEVVVVHEAVLALFLVVGFGQAQQVDPLFQELGVVPGQDRFQGQVFVDRGPQDVGQGFLSGKSPGHAF